jgi:tetratricopeptide (TPR) repeat protein
MEPNHDSLVPANRRSLAPISRTNSLVVRGLAEISSFAVRRETNLAFKVEEALSFYFRGVRWYHENAYHKAHDELAAAIHLFDEVVAVEPTNVFAVRHLAKAYWWMGVANERLEIDDPPDPHCDFRLSSAACFAEAMKGFDRAIDLCPSDATAYAERAEAKAWASWDEGTIEDFSEAIRIEPANPAWRALRGINWLDTNNYDRALEDLNEAIRLNSDRQMQVCITFTPVHGQTPSLYDGGNPTGKACVRINVRDWLERAFRARAKSSLARADYGQAIRDYSEAYRIASHDGTVPLDSDLARTDIGCFSLADRNSSLYDFAMAYWKRGYESLKQKDYDLALKDMDEVIRLNLEGKLPARAHYGRGIVLFKKGKIADAIDDLDQAIRLDASHSAAYFARGSARLDQGDYHGAIADFDEAIRLDPSDADAYAERRRALLEMTTVPPSGGHR